ncbi:MAG TPA: lytic transglycosylase domain-containing protein [Stellaceae bacterium]|nr:lytic transglycosylase domain-containing protein [Stellaceae bacterium]
MPAPLSTADAEHYRKIFALQAGAQWSEADREIAELRDRQLLGTVEAQRYLHPKFRSSYADLARWLAHHADEPDAKAIHALALKRKPKAALAPAKPVVAPLVPRDLDADTDEAGMDGGLGHHPLTPAERRRASQLRTEILDLAAREPRRAELTLAGAEAKRLLNRDETNELRAAISEGYLAEGHAQEALMLSAAAPNAHWQAGLAAWRLGRLNEAGTHFQAVTRAAGQSGSMVAAGAFWAARIELRNRRPELVNYWLGIAAEHPHTFYGLLARRTLGVDTYFRFETDPFTELDAQIMTGLPSGRRALALLQVGETTRAEAELRVLASRTSGEIIESIVALADRANMPGLSLLLAGRVVDSEGRHLDHALYPVPRWTPIGGFTVDRALLFALMRQESQFLPRVQSNAGAIGLMQLMPATARAMAERTGVELPALSKLAGRDALSDPELNMALAQEYITLLMHDERIKGNLLLLATAYNGGPGAVQHARLTAELRKDPLLFLESIPLRETRVFTHRVLTNYWIYRLRLGQPSPDLDALAAGQWPTYTALDSAPEPDRRHAENR